MGGFLADHEASAVVAGVEPFGRRSGSAAGAIETHARTHFDEGSALWKFYRFFEFDANQSDPLIVLADGRAPSDGSRLRNASFTDRLAGMPRWAGLLICHWADDHGQGGRASNRAGYIR